jgi:hypothetical protein
MRTEAGASIAQRPQAVQATSQSSSSSSPARLVVDDGEVVRVHADGIEVAHLGAVADAEAAPEAGLAAAGDLGRSDARPETVVAGAEARHVRPAGTGQPRHHLLLRADVDAEVVGDLRARRIVAHRALARQRIAPDQRLGEGPAAREAAGAAVGVGKHVLDDVDAHVLLDVELAVGHDEERCQDERETSEAGDRRQDDHGQVSVKPEVRVTSRSLATR